MGRLTLQICALLLSEVGAGLLDSRGKVDLYVLGHDLVGAAHLAIMFTLAHHLLDTLDDAVAFVEPLGDGLRKLLYLPFLILLGLLIVEPRQYVLLVQPLQLLALARDVGQQLRHFVR